MSEGSISWCIASCVRNVYRMVQGLRNRNVSTSGQESFIGKSIIGERRDSVTKMKVGLSDTPN